ncbi:WAT1-related protein [Canna indica]|uniref:WAT1-related protein n=1 Tax=Canna indica TaxID=4628 RepID=A0AAQ3Q952_9LILI|nr:WAT1-related protein [Canna indica]
MGNGRDWKEVAQGMKPAAAMVLIQVVFAGVNILYKLALNDGMEVKILVAYRYLFAAAFISPVAFFVERKQRPKLTWKILGLTFLCGLFGAALAQILYVSSMKLTSATFTCAIGNLAPAITFILAVSFRLERLRIRTNYGQAKILGTLLGLGGAMLLTFYKGVDIKLWPADINLVDRLDHRSHPSAMHPHSDFGNRIAGSFMAVASCLCFSLWLIIQAKLAQVYPYHYSSTALMCLMGCIQTSIIALCAERHKIHEWRIGFDIRLLTVAYSGIFASGMTFTLLGWCIRKKGPVYASAFNPLILVFVALLGSLLLSEKLYLGTLLGAVLIVIGMYIVLWGKGREELNFGVDRSLSEDAMKSIEVVVVQEAATSTFESVDEPNNNKDAEERGEASRDII